MFHFVFFHQASRFLALSFLTLLLLSGCNSGKKSASQIDLNDDIRKSEIYSEAAISSAHPLASEAGKYILQQGGNAVDAAIAVQFALAVVYPIAGNIGGGGFMIYRSADGELAALDFREKAPGEASKDMYLDENGNVIEGMSTAGHLASGVPGTVDGMWKAFNRYSRLGDWPILLEAAIQLAEKGFPITRAEANNLNNYRPHFLDNNSGPNAFTSKDSWKEGDLLVQKDLARSLREISEYGRDGFYASWVADSLVQEMKSNGGIISNADLENYESVWREPQVCDYKSYRIATMPLPSSGGIVLSQILKMIESRLDNSLGHHHPETIHLLVEAERRAYADRAFYLGDEDFIDVPDEYILSDNYLQERFSDFNAQQATPSQEVENQALAESEETTHFSIIDAEGNAVSLTTTINTAYGSGVVVDGAGFLLNNEMDDFSVKPGSPNYFGLVGNEANAIEAGKRMLSSMTPTIVERNGELHIVVGTPGGSTIITSVLQVLLNIIEFDMNATEAVSTCRYHHQYLPDVIQMEASCLDSITRTELQLKAHALKERSPIGRVECLLVNAQNLIEAAADPRGDDSVSGY